MNACDLLTFGELQVRLKTQNDERLANATTLRVVPAGSEANVAAVLSMLGHRASLVSALGPEPLADRLLHFYRGHGVDVSGVHRAESGRTALYFHESSWDVGSSQVVYDREGTPIREMAHGDFSWPDPGSPRWTFGTGITASLTTRCGETVAAMLSRARAAGSRTAYDVNHRSRLWDAGAARDYLLGIAGDLDLVFCSARDAAALFSITSGPESACEELRDRLGVATVVMTDGDRPARCVGPDGSWVGEPTPQVVVDRPGAGDAFVAGVLHGLLSDTPELSLQHGGRAARLAISRTGDVVPVTAADLTTDRADIAR